MHKWNKTHTHSLPERLPMLTEKCAKLINSQQLTTATTTDILNFQFNNLHYLRMNLKKYGHLYK